MDVIPCGKTIYVNIYCQQLDQLVLAIQQKRCMIMYGGFQQFYYMHDNARPHNPMKTIQILRDIGCNILPHTPYSPDLAPSDFYLFSLMKSAILVRNYQCIEEIQVKLKGKTKVLLLKGSESCQAGGKMCICHRNY